MTLLNVFFVYSENKPRNAFHTIVAHFMDLNGSLGTYDLLQHNPRDSSGAQGTHSHHLTNTLPCNLTKRELKKHIESIE